MIKQIVVSKMYRPAGEFIRENRLNHFETVVITDDSVSNPNTPDARIHKMRGLRGLPVYEVMPLTHESVLKKEMTIGEHFYVEDENKSKEKK